MAASNARRWLSVLVWAVVALGALRTTLVAARAVGASSYGFVAYYAASRAVLERAPGARFYEDDWFRSQTARFEPTAPDIFNANPPPMAAIMLPVAALPYRVARGLWIGGSLVLFWAASLWLARRAGLRGLAGAGFLAVASLAGPVRENLAQGQVYIAAYALIFAAWLGCRLERPARLGLSTGTLLGTKTAALGLWPLMLVERRWHAIAWGAGTVLALSVALLPLTGTAMWPAYLGSARALTASDGLASTAYQSVPGFFRHVLGDGGARFGAPILHTPALAATLTWSTEALMLAISLYAALRRGSAAAAFSAFVLLGFALSPVTAEHHFAMALVPIALLWGALDTSSQVLSRADVPVAPGLAAAVFVGTFLVLANLRTYDTSLEDGWRALLLYPRLYGTLLLWICSVRLAISGRAAEPITAPAELDLVAAR